MTLVNRINTDYYDASGSAITASNQPTIDSGVAARSASDNTLTNVGVSQSYIVVNPAVAGNQQGLISVSMDSAVTAASVTGSVGGTSGYCKFTKSSHGLVVGDTLVFKGATINSLNVIHTITAKDTNTFTTDITYVASTTAGDYQKVLLKSYMGAQNNKVYKGRANTLIATSTNALIGGNKHIKSINKVIKFYVAKEGTAILAGNYNFTSATWANGYPEVSTNQTYDRDGNAVIDGSIGTAANPTQDAYVYITYKSPKLTSTSFSRTTW